MNTVIHVKANRETKENAQKLARELGLSLSDVINASLRNFIRTREVYFSDAPQMTPQFEKYLEGIEEDIKHHRNLVGPFETPQEMDKFLDSLK
jgi:antitoxin component of RelBE/YafQ-DinJ toxin-antitoxin module